jgi:hypothetical protein
VNARLWAGRARYRVYNIDTAVRALDGEQSRGIGHYVSEMAHTVEHATKDLQVKGVEDGGTVDAREAHCGRQSGAATSAWLPIPPADRVPINRVASVLHSPRSDNGVAGEYRIPMGSAALRRRTPQWRAQLLELDEGVTLMGRGHLRYRKWSKTTN